MELSTAQSKSWMRRKTLKVNSGEASAHAAPAARCFRACVICSPDASFRFRNQNEYV